MKNKILFLLMFLVLHSVHGISQTDDMSNIRFAVLGGVNYQNLTTKDFLGSELSTEGIVGFHAGVNAQIKIVDEFYFQPGLLFSTKGADVTEAQITEKFRLSYIELPLDLVYKATLGNGAIMIGFGPYLAYGILGKTQTVTSLGTVDSDIEFTNVIETTDPLTVSYFKPLDVGANVFVGYEMSSSLFLQLNSQLGLINIYPEDRRFPGGKNSIKNIGFGLSLGYRF